MGEHDAAAAADFRIGDRVELVEAHPAVSYNGPPVGARGTVRMLAEESGSRSPRIGVEFEPPFSGGHNLGLGRSESSGWFLPPEKLRLVRSAEACAAAAASCARPADPKLAAGLEGRTLEPLFPVGARVRVAGRQDGGDPPVGATGIVDRVYKHLRFVLLDATYHVKHAGVLEHHCKAWLAVDQLAADPSPTTSALPPSHRGAAGSLRRQMEAAAAEKAVRDAAEDAADAERHEPLIFTVTRDAPLFGAVQRAREWAVLCDHGATARVIAEGDRIDVRCSPDPPGVIRGPGSRMSDNLAAGSVITTHPPAAAPDPLDAIRAVVRQARRDLAESPAEIGLVAFDALDRIFDLTLPPRFRGDAAERAA